MASCEECFAFRETLRDEAASSLNELRQSGFRLAVLTGDHGRRAEMLGAELHVPIESELLPEDKLAFVDQIRTETGLVAMVGDGINDAPALSAADVGIALGCGADVSRDAADVCLLSNDLRKNLLDDSTRAPHQANGPRKSYLGVCLQQRRHCLGCLWTAESNHCRDRNGREQPVCRLQFIETSWKVGAR